MVRSLSAVLRKEDVLQCPLCKAAQFAVELVGKDHDTATGDYQVRRCLECSMLFTSPRPIEEDLPLLYEDRSFDQLPQGRSLLARVRLARARARIADLAPSFPSGQLRIAEVGVGDGFFASVLAQSSRCDAMMGTDYFDEAPPSLAGPLRPARASYRAYPKFFASDEQYDVIFARFVLEHVSNPVLFVERLDAKLAARGLLIIEVPNWRCLWRKLFRSNFAELGLPAHLLHFSPETLKRLLQAYDTQIRQDLHGLTLARSLGNMLGWRTFRAGPVSMLWLVLEIVVDTLIGPPANMTAIARKRAQSTSTPA